MAGFVFPNRSIVSEVERIDPKLRRVGAQIDRNFDEVGRHLDAFRPKPLGPAIKIGGTTGVPSIFTANWTDWDASANWGQGYYWKDEDGWVHLSGLVKATGGPASNTMLILPEGYRPPWSQDFMCFRTNATQVGITVDPAGQVTVGSYPAFGDLVSLDGIRFFAGTVEEFFSPVDVYNDQVDPYHLLYTVGYSQKYDTGSRPPIFHRRKWDGLCRGMGYWAVTTATLGQGQVAVPGAPDPSTGASQGLGGTYNWSGAVGEWVRVDYFGNGGQVDRSFGTVGGSTALSAAQIPDWRWYDRGPYQPQWTDMTLANGWVNYGAPFRKAQYYKDAHGVVHLRGLIRLGSTAISAALNSALPSGYRPVRKVMFPCFGHGVTTAQRIDCNTDGTLSNGMVLSGNSYLSLDNIYFRTT